MITIPPEKPTLLLSVRDVAAMLGICTRGVWKLCAAGQLPPPIKLGGSTRWRMADLADHIAALPATK